MLIVITGLPGCLVDAAHAVNGHVLNEILDDQIGALVFGWGVFKAGVHRFHGFLLS